MDLAQLSLHLDSPLVLFRLAWLSGLLLCLLAACTSLHARGSPEPSSPANSTYPVETARHAFSLSTNTPQSAQTAEARIRVQYELLRNGILLKVRLVPSAQSLSRTQVPGIGDYLGVRRLDLQPHQEVEVELTWSGDEALCRFGRARPVRDYWSRGAFDPLAPTRMPRLVDMGSGRIALMLEHRGRQSMITIFETPSGYDASAPNGTVTPEPTSPIKSLLLQNCEIDIQPAAHQLPTVTLQYEFKRDGLVLTFEGRYPIQANGPATVPAADRLRVGDDLEVEIVGLHHRVPEQLVLSWSGSNLETLTARLPITRLNHDDPPTYQDVHYPTTGTFDPSAPATAPLVTLLPSGVALVECTHKGKRAVFTVLPPP